jgi:hypothetical protein
METKEEFTRAQVRRFLSALYINRARRHLKTLATQYGWSPEQLAAYEEKFIVYKEFVPSFTALHVPPN